MDFCRLCMSSDNLTNLYINNEDNLYLKVISCIDIKLDPGDGLSSSICMTCKNNITKFYEFKQKCLEVDSKIRYDSTKTDSNENNIASLIDINIKLENSIIDSDLKDTLNTWLSDEAMSDIQLNYVQFHSEIVSDERRGKFEKNIPQDYDYKFDSTETFLSHIPFKEISPKAGFKDKAFQCELCGYIFKVKSVLEKHILSHRGVKQFSCKLCSKCFTRAEHERVHMRSHFGVRPYICEICGKSSTKRQDLIRHLRIHSDEKKYSCPRCEKRFKRSGDVLSHMRTHTGARPYKCTVCNKSYTSHSGLRKHHKTHCKEEPENM